MMLAWLQVLFCVVVLSFCAGAISMVGLLVAVYVARLPSWKHLKDMPGPNEKIPLRWIISQYLQTERLKSLVPYNVSRLQARVALSKMFQADGLCRFYLGTLPFVLVFRADYAEVVLSKTLTKSSNYSLLHSWIGTGLATSTGSKWKSRRRLLTPAFHFRILDDFFRPINEHSREMVAKIYHFREETDWIDMVALSMSCTFGVMLETVMGVTASEDREDCEAYVKNVNTLSNTFIMRAERPWLYPDFTFHRTEIGQRYKKAVAAAHAFSTKIIQRRRRELMKERNVLERTAGENGSSKKRRLAFLDILLCHSLDVDESFTDQDIREEVDTFMGAGYDTTSVAIACTCYLIALYTDVQKKVQEELDTVLGEGKTKDIDTEDLKKLKYLDCVVKECQRICPSVPMIGRTVTEPFTLGKYVLPKGTSVQVFIYQLHRDSDVFPDPEVFNPDRFLPENCASRHPFAFMPFSAGSRNCIGQKFASMEVKIAVGHIFRTFNVQPLKQRDQLLLSTEIVLRAVGGLWLKFTPREEWLQVRSDSK